MPIFFFFPQARIFFTLFFLIAFCKSSFGSPYDDFMKKGKDHMGLFQYKEAKAMFEKAISLDPSKFDGHYNLALALRKLNDINGAIASLEKAHKIDREDLDCAKALNAFYVQIAKEMRASGKRDSMLAYLEKACDVYPQNTQLWASYFGELAADGNWTTIAKKGSSVLNSNREALEVGDDKNLQKALILVAKAYKELKDHVKARDFIKSASRINNASDELISLKNELGAEASQVATNFLAEGKAYYEKGQFRKAVEALEKASGAESDPEIMNLLELARKKATIQDFTKAADDAEKKGDFDEAQEKIQKALEYAENDPILQKRLASLTQFIETRDRKIAEEKKRREDEARAKRLASAEKNAKLKEALEEARRNEQKGFFEAAIRNYKEALKYDKDNPDILAALEKAQKANEDAKKLDQEFHSIMDEAEKYLKNGANEKAIEAFKKLTVPPFKPSEAVYSGILEAAANLGRTEEVAKYLEKLRGLKNDSLALDFYQGWLAYMQGDYNGAYEPLGKVYQKDRVFRPELRKMVWTVFLYRYKGPLIMSALIVGYFLLGAVYRSWVTLKKATQDSRIEKLIQSGDYVSAVPLIEKRLQDSEYLPNRRPWMLFLAEGYLKMGKATEARTVANEVLTKDPKNIPAQRIIGEATLQLQDTSPEGIEKLNNLFKIDETRKDVLSFLVSFYKAQKSDSKTALDILHKQITVSPEDEDTLLYLAEYYSKKTIFNKDSLKVFEKATKMDPDRPEFANGLAQSYLQSGKREEATKVMQAAREKWPGNELFQTEIQGFRSGQTMAFKPKQTSSGAVQNEKKGTSSGSTAKTTQGFNLQSALGSMKKAEPVAQGEMRKCKSCGADNHPREYYCTKCGKPIQ